MMKNTHIQGSIKFLDEWVLVLDCYQQLDLFSTRLINSFSNSHENNNQIAQNKMHKKKGYIIDMGSISKGWCFEKNR